MTGEAILVPQESGFLLPRPYSDILKRGHDTPTGFFLPWPQGRVCSFAI